MTCTMRLYWVSKCGRRYNGNHSRPQVGTPVVVLMASLTLRGFRIRAATGVPAGSGAVLRVVRAGIAYSETVMASLT